MMQSLWTPFPLSFEPPPDPRTQATPPTVFLRGLPFGTTKEEVCAIFSTHGLSDRIANESDAITMLTKSNGKPSGNALVQLGRADDVAVVQSVLHMTDFGN